MAKVKSVRVVMHHSVVKEFLRGDEVQLDLGRRADAIRDAAGGEPDFVSEVHLGSARARALVITATFRGMKAEADERRLSNALSAGRG